MTLNNAEYELLSRIARKSKLDCWFQIRQTAKGDDYVFDSENHKRLSLKTAIRQLMKGIEEMYDFYLAENDYITLINLLIKLI